jgi:hypothetical protein
MTITSSGYRCDVCDLPILGLTDDDMAYQFKLSIIKNELHACKVCIGIIKRLNGGDWKELPQGHLRRFFEEQSTKV